MKIKFSAKRIPEVGETFVSTKDYNLLHKATNKLLTHDKPIKAGTQLTVEGYAFEHGWLYIECAPTMGLSVEQLGRENARRMLDAGGRCYTLAAGCDVLAWEPEEES